MAPLIFWRRRTRLSHYIVVVTASLLTVVPTAIQAQTQTKPQVKAQAKGQVKAPAQTKPASAAAAADYAADAPRVLLMPQRETTLVSQTVSQVREIVGGLGNSFKKGQRLVRFDCGQPVARRDMARADLGAAKNNLAAKERLKALKAAGGVEVEMARSAMTKAQAELQLASVQIGQCSIRAPYAGRIVRQYVRQYQGVKAGDPLLEIVASGPLKLRLNVPSRWLVWLKPGKKFEIKIDETGKQYPAKVTALNARVDAASQSIEIEGLVVGKHPDLLAGMSGTARFTQK